MGSESDRTGVLVRMDTRVLSVSHHLPRAHGQQATCGHSRKARKRGLPRSQPRKPLDLGLPAPTVGENKCPFFKAPSVALEPPQLTPSPSGTHKATGGLKGEAGGQHVPHREIHCLYSHDDRNMHQLCPCSNH